MRTGGAIVLRMVRVVPEVAERNHCLMQRDDARRFA